MEFSTKLLLIIVLCFSVFAPMAFAESEGKRSLISLGDSITFGYNLDLKNGHPSKQAFPALIAKEENYRLRNFGVPGDTSANLLDHLKTKQYKQAIANANLITIDIGNNDLLQGAHSIIQNLMTNPDYKPTPEDIALLQKITSTLEGNLSQIIAQIRGLTDAPIILYTIYNPYYDRDQQTAPMLSGINTFISSYDKDPSIVVADAFSAFTGKQNILILPDDIHPTVEGQEVLAELAIAAMGTFNHQYYQDHRG